MAELVFEVVQEADGGYCAECLTENIFTEGDAWELLRKNVREATMAFFCDRPRPERIRLCRSALHRVSRKARLQVRHLLSS